jgi:hypothetical protein
MFWSDWRTLLGVMTTVAAAAACGGRSLPVPPPVPERAGCYVLGDEATVAPFLFPDTLELAAEWFLPQDSTGGRLRVVRPRDASLGTYRAFGGRFWWESAADSIVVTRSDGATSTVLTLPTAPAEFTGVIRTVGAGLGLAESVKGRRIACREPS